MTSRRTRVRFGRVNIVHLFLTVIIGVQEASLSIPVTVQTGTFHPEFPLRLALCVYAAMVKFWGEINTF